MHNRIISYSDLHLEFDFTRCSIETISWVLSAISYDEARISQIVSELFRGFKSRFWSHKRLSHFYGVVYDEKTGRIWDVNRGTDGDGPIGNLWSWLYDIDVFKGREGVNKGFKRLGDTSFNNVKQYLKHFQTIIHTGHSQGAGVAPYKACLSIENLWLYERVYFLTFAPPPTGNGVFAKRVNEYIAEGILSGTLFINPGDPIASKNLRDEDAVLLNGVDVGNLAILPDINLHDRGPLALLNHSCGQYHASYGLFIEEDAGKHSNNGRLLFSPTYHVPFEDKKLLAVVSRLIIN